MIEKVCDYLTAKIRHEMPEVDDERAEAINFGLQLLVGEMPKIILLCVIAFIFRIGPLVVFAYISMLPYKVVAGGFHLKTHIGCTLGTFIVYFGNVFVSKFIVMKTIAKYMIIVLAEILAIIMISMYAPADTINMPILMAKERRIKKILSYIFATVTLIVALIVQNSVLSNILIINVLVESVSISRLAYKITKNEYGFEAYSEI